jgi:hypothetical protein
MRRAGITIRIVLIMSGHLMLTVSSCKKKMPPPPEDLPEVITTVQLSLIDSASGNARTYFFKDPDGDGGQAGFYGPDRATQSDSVISLRANTVYFASVNFLDETKEPVEDLTGDIRELGDEHMLFYNNGSNSVVSSSNPVVIKLSGSSLTIRYDDLDKSGKPIGLKTRWRTSDSTSLKWPLRITLRHQPGVKDGTYAPGETDVELIFKVKISS